jgi:hypothetical protein
MTRTYYAAGGKEGRSMNQKEAERRVVLIGVLVAYGYDAPTLPAVPTDQLELMVDFENGQRVDDGGAWDGDDADGGF